MTGQLLGLVAASPGEKLLDAPDRVALLIEQAVDSLGKRDVGRAVVAAVAGPLQRPKLRKSRLPIAEDVLGNAKILGKLTDGAKSLVALARSLRHDRGLSRR